MLKYRLKKLFWNIIKNALMSKIVETRCILLNQLPNRMKNNQYKVVLNKIVIQMKIIIYI